jgi:hypothetical protein
VLPPTGRVASLAGARTPTPTATARTRSRDRRVPGIDGHPPMAAVDRYDQELSAGGWAEERDPTSTSTGSRSFTLFHAGFMQAACGGSIGAMNQRSSDFFTCKHCGRTLQKGRSDAEALQEHARVFGCVPPPKDRAVVCDDCWVQIIAWAKATGVLPAQPGWTWTKPG